MARDIAIKNPKILKILDLIRTKAEKGESELHLSYNDDNDEFRPIKETIISLGYNVRKCWADNDNFGEETDYIITW
ncbi:MAG: hypothetical protein EKK61_05665 [Rickettsiales bacterium]|nr:MAG: hypothetical protein EKK61_05665 [Rickettsiales bacterium]